MARNIIRNALLALTTCIIAAGAGTAYIFREELQIIRSIKKLDGGHPCYVMDFKNGYHIEELLQKNISTDKELAAILAGYISHGFYRPSVNPDMHIGCSTLTARTTGGNMLWGRNFDWYESTPIIVRATPEDGYASISTCEFSNITGDKSSRPEGIANAFLAVAAYYVPMDGINEKGLCVANLEVNEGGQELIEAGKNNITITMAIRLLLDKAANIEEAAALLEQYDICPSGGISAHLAISDRTGKAVVAEFMDGQTVITQTPAVTNFNIYNGNIAAGGESAMSRYSSLISLHEASGGIMTKEGMAHAMESVAQKEGKWQTRWTLVYEDRNLPGMDNLAADYYWAGDFTRAHTITMK